MNNNFNNGCSCRNNDNNECENNCIAEILQVINVLQSNACPENCLNSCDRPALGGGTNCVVCNTRPIMLYTCSGNGTPWSMPTTRTNTNCNQTGETGCSNVFRVEKVDGCCATLRVLTYNPETATYTATNSFFTVNTDCLCSIKCLGDTFVEGV